MKMKLDFTDVQSGFELMPEGDYEVAVFDLEEKTSSNGNPMIVAKLKVADGKFKGRQLFHNIVIMKQTMFKVKEFLTACGVIVPEGEVDVDFMQCLGRKLIAGVGHEKYQGKDKERVMTLSPLQGEGIIAIGEDELPF